MVEARAGKPSTFGRAFWCAFIALIVAFATLILRLTFLEQGGWAESATFYFAAFIFLAGAPGLHVASLFYAMRGISQGGNRLTAFICILLNLVFVAINFLFGAAALFG
ncbi:MAG: hypothetical protein AB7P20_15370 [Rhizobiaceae bacterium]